MMRHTLALLAALALSGCTRVDHWALGEWCGARAEAQLQGTQHSRIPVIAACQLDPDNQRKFEHWALLPQWVTERLP